MRRRDRERIEQSWYRPPTPDICPLCKRLIPKSQRDEHHLIPKLKGGKETVALHRICHKQIHALFSESELAQHYATIDALLAHEAVQRFVSWVSSKPIGFNERTRATR